MARLFHSVFLYLKPIRYVLLCLAAAGALNAAMDTVSFHFDRSVFSYLHHDSYFNPQISWVNKWAVDESGKPVPGVDRYWESSRLFVVLTDFWHLAKSLMIGCIMLAVICYRRETARSPIALADFILCYAAFTGSFTVFYDCILVI